MKTNPLARGLFGVLLFGTTLFNFAADNQPTINIKVNAANPESTMQVEERILDTSGKTKSDSKNENKVEKIDADIEPANLSSVDAKIPVIDKPYKTGTQLYVHSPIGLNLRSSPNLNSNKVARMHYGDKVMVLSRPDSLRVIKYDNIYSLWIQVKFKNHQGYAFGGYLSHLPTPSTRSLKDYKTKLKTAGLILANEGSEDNLIDSGKKKKRKKKKRKNKTDLANNAEQSITLSNTKFIDGFLVARQLFGIPATFRYPGPSTTTLTIINDPGLNPNKTGQSLQIKRNPKGEIIEMTLVEKSQGRERKSTVKVTEKNKIRLQVVNQVPSTAMKPN